MAFNGSGTFARLYNWVTDRNNGIKIRADRMDAELDGIATGLSNCITKDGQTTVSANIPFNDKKITGLGDATADGDALNRRTADARYLELDGTGTMTGVIQAADGTVSAPGYSFGSDTNSGWYRIGADNWGWSAAGTKVLDVSASGLGITGALTITGALNGVASLDATTEATIEGAIDTLANLTSIQGYTFNLTGNFIRSGAHSLTLTTTDATNVTFPTTGTLATLAGTETLTNKTINLTSNTLSTTVAQLNSALSDGDVATLAGTETLTNKTLTSPTINGGAISGALVRMTEQATTSGSTFDFSIPAGAKRITVMFSGVTFSGTLLVQLGDAGGVESTSYTSVSANSFTGGSVGGSTSTSGFVVANSAASGIMTIANIGGNVWVQAHDMFSSTVTTAHGGGVKTLSDTLTTVRITATSFSAGSVNVIYE